MIMQSAFSSESHSHNWQLELRETIKAEGNQDNS